MTVNLRAFFLASTAFFSCSGAIFAPAKEIDLFCDEQMPNLDDKIEKSMFEVDFMNDSQRRALFLELSVHEAYLNSPNAKTDYMKFDFLSDRRWTCKELNVLMSELRKKYTILHLSPYFLPAKEPTRLFLPPMSLEAAKKSRNLNC